MRNAALTFVHGVNNGPSERARLKEWLLAILQKNNVLTLFEAPNSLKSHNVQVGQWESVGDFGIDLLALTKPDWRKKVIGDIELAICDTQDTLLKQGLNDDAHVIVAHSMGQPLAIAAIRHLVDHKGLLVPTALISLGGPMGNTSPVFKSYFHWCKLSWWQSDKKLGLTSWTDLVNQRDSICCDGVSMLIGGTNSVAPGYRKPTGCSKVEYVGSSHGSLSKSPSAEHNVYFETQSFFDTLRRVTLTGK